MTNETDFSKHKFLIIGGSSKAGTTSVFTYLAHHPQICAADDKETRFFLDTDYPLPSEKRYQSDGASAYLSFFTSVDGKSRTMWNLEATPDYLYSPTTPHLIHKTLPKVAFIFLLREPLSRLLSFYQFGQQINEIPRRMSFDEYVRLQRNNAAANWADKYRHPAFFALQNGGYSLYLRPFLKLFGRSAIHIGFYEDLRRDPHGVMVSICRWAGIDESYFSGYVFEVKNKGFKVRAARLHRAYFESRRRARLLAHRWPKLRWLFRRVGDKINFVYRKINVTNRADVVMSSETREFICSYYHEEAARLKEMLGIEIPWGDRVESDAAGCAANTGTATRVEEGSPQQYNISSFSA